jgi:hypothetical protein
MSEGKILGRVQAVATILSVVAAATAYVICGNIQTTHSQQSVPFRPFDCNAPPAVSDCGDPPKPDGLYRLKSGAKLSDGRDLCINVDTDSGQYQQLDCRDVPSSQFFFSTGRRPDHCYRIEQERNGGRETDSNVAGVGFNQIKASCRAAILSVQWQLVAAPGGFFRIKNEQTGRCITAGTDNPNDNHLSPTGPITTRPCQKEAITNQLWMLFK